MLLQVLQAVHFGVLRKPSGNWGPKPGPGVGYVLGCEILERRKAIHDVAEQQHGK
jgi:hypothetical protein